MIGKLACVAFRHFRQVPAAEEVAELSGTTAVGRCASVSSSMSHAVCVQGILGALATLRCLAPWEAPGVDPALATLRGRRTLAAFDLAAGPHGWPFLRVGEKMASGGGRGGLCRLFWSCHIEKSARAPPLVAMAPKAKPTSVVMSERVALDHLDQVASSRVAATWTPAGSEHDPVRHPPLRHGRLPDEHLA